MAEQSEEEKQVQTALTILLNAASQARLIAAEHDQVRQAAQIVANKLGLTDGQDAPQIEMPEDQEG